MKATKIFIKNEYLQFKRSNLFQQKLILKIFISLALAMAFFQFGIAGYLLPSMIKTITSKIILNILFGTILFDLLLKAMLLKPPSGIAYMYLTMPIKKKELSLFLALKLFTHYTSLLVIIFWIPFLVSTLGISSQTIFWLTLVVLILIVNSIIIFMLKSDFLDGLKLIFALVFLSLFVFSIHYFGVIDITFLTSRYMNSGQFLIKSVIHAILILGLLYLSQNKIADKLYINQPLSNFKLVNHSGSTLKASYEWKMLWRNKRYRNTFFLNSLLIGGSLSLNLLIISSGKEGFISSALKFASINTWFLIVLSSIGQFFLKAESTFIEKYRTIPLGIKTIFRNKFQITAIILSIAAVFTLPLILFYPNIWQFILSCFIFNSGVIIYLLLLRGTYNETLFEINAQVLFNYQGADFTFYFPDIFIFSILFILPFIYYFSLLFDVENIFLISISIVGLSSLLMRNNWYKLLKANYDKRKYIMMEGINKK